MGITFKNCPKEILDDFIYFHIHKEKMKRICKEILNVCWCHGCGNKKHFSGNYVGSFCNKWCWKDLYYNYDYNNDTSWCVLGENCLECNHEGPYTLRESSHIQHYYNIDPMGTKDKKYTKNSKPCIDIIYPEDYTIDCNYEELVGQY